MWAEQAVVGAIVALLTLQEPGEVRLPCHTKVDVAIGCIGIDNSPAPENAADLYARYGLDSEAIRKAESYINRFDCLTITALTHKIDLTAHGKLIIATANGDVPVYFVQASNSAEPERKPILWIAEPYLQLPCPPSIRKP